MEKKFFMTFISNSRNPDVHVGPADEQEAKEYLTEKGFIEHDRRGPSTWLWIPKDRQTNYPFTFVNMRPMQGLKDPFEPL